MFAGAKQAAKIPSPSLHAGDTLPRSEKPSHYYKVHQTRQEKTVSHAGQYLEKKHISAPTRTAPNTVHVLYSADPAPRPVAHHAELSTAPKYHYGTGTRQYHTPVLSDGAEVSQHGHHPSSVVTTKPYAIVNAIPAQPPDIGYRSIPLPQKPAAAGGSGGGQHHHVMQIVPATGSAAQQLVSEEPNQHRTPSSATSSVPSPPLPPPPSYSTYIAEKKNTNEKVSEEDIQSIQKKISDAFTQSSEVMLVSAFEEAWKKFQDNDKVYKQRHSLTKDKAIAAEANLVQQMSAKPCVVAPKLLSENVRMLPSTSQGHQYIHVVPPNVTPQQLLIQQIPGPTEYTNIYTIPTTAPSGNQVRVAGLYYPSTDRTNQSDSHKVIVTQKHPPTTKPQSSMLQRVVVQERPSHGTECMGPSHGTSQVKLATAKGTLPAAGPQPGTAETKQHSQKKCSWCGGNAIYLCSGCHREWYCGSECQLKSWEVHSDQCKA